MASCGYQAVAGPLSYCQTWSKDVGLRCNPEGPRGTSSLPILLLDFPTHSTSSPLRLGTQTGALLVIVCKLCEQMPLEAQGLRIQGPECA